MYVNVFNLGKSFINAPSDFKQFEDNADREIQRLRADLEQKRLKAIEKLGDRWIVKGGKYNPCNVTLGKK